MSLSIEFIQESTANGSYEISLHADEERLADGLTIDEVERALSKVELLEDYPDDPRGSSCLVLGSTNIQPLHVVCGLTKQARLIIITIYRPEMPKWLDERTRNRPK